VQLKKAQWALSGGDKIKIRIRVDPDSGSQLLTDADGHPCSRISVEIIDKGFLNLAQDSQDDLEKWREWGHHVLALDAAIKPETANGGSGGRPVPEGAEGEVALRSAMLS
ncbi:hypothetical protein HK101_007847, partial [Irineochytrium annulatum]